MSMKIDPHLCFCHYNFPPPRTLFFKICVYASVGTGVGKVSFHNEHQSHCFCLSILLTYESNYITDQFKNHTTYIC